MANLHNIDIRPDDDASWINWGKLIFAWLDGKETLPKTKDDLEKLWDKWEVLATMRGKPTREVSVQIYDSEDDTKKFVIAIPTKNMIKKDQNYLKKVYSSGSKQYPTPRWYGRIYEGNPAKRVLGSEEEMLDIGYARLGEYVINECM